MLFPQKTGCPAYRKIKGTNNYLCTAEWLVSGKMTIQQNKEKCNANWGTNAISSPDDALCSVQTKLEGKITQQFDYAGDLGEADENMDMKALKVALGHQHNHLKSHLRIHRLTKQVSCPYIWA